MRVRRVPAEMATGAAFAPAGHLAGAAEHVKVRRHPSGGRANLRGMGASTDLVELKREMRRQTRWVARQGWAVGEGPTREDAIRACIAKLAPVELESEKRLSDLQKPVAEALIPVFKEFLDGAQKLANEFKRVHIITS